MDCKLPAPCCQDNFMRKDYSSDESSGGGEQMEIQQFAACIRKMEAEKYLTDTAFSELFRLLLIGYMEKVMQEKFDSKMNAMTDKFANSLSAYMEKIF
jgi:hypothetical protein